MRGFKVFHGIPLPKCSSLATGRSSDTSGAAAGEPRGRKMPEPLQTVGELPEEEKKRIAENDRLSREEERKAQEWKAKHEGRNTRENR